jgi:ubiquitin carboxyl-terminal hydrolase L3
MQTQNPDERAQTLYDSLELERAHMTVAVRGDSRPPDPREDNALHFITFVKDRDGGLWELEGGVQGPILRGTLEQNEDCLSERAIQLGVGKFLHASERTGELEVSCVAVVAESGRGGERG